MFRRIARTLAPVAAMLAIGVAAFPSTGTDDSYITYWPAYTLAHYGAIVNVNGARVEQSSSLLWTLLLALLCKVTRIDVESLGVPLSALAGVATLWATGVLARRVEPRAEETARWLIALSFPNLLWSFSGMETALAAFSWTALAACAIPYVFEGAGGGALGGSIAALTAFLLVRPEAPVVALVALAPIAGLSFVLSVRTPTLRAAAARSAALLLVGAFAAAAIAVCRHAYFGAWMPQPVHAKVSASASGAPGRVFDGLLYAVGFESVRGSQPPGWLHRIEIALLVSSGLLASAIAVKRFIAAAGPRDAAARGSFAIAVFFLASLSFAVVVGGDWMGAWRFLCAALPCAVVLASTALTRLSRTTALATSGAAVAFELLVLGRTASTPALSLPLWFDVPAASRAYPFFVRHNVPHLRDAAFMPAMNAAVKRKLASRGPPVSILSGQAGYVVYHVGKRFFGQVRFIDRVSLVTRDLQECPLLAGTETDVGFSLATTEPLFDPTSRVHEECNLPLPDIVFDSGRRQLYEVMMRSRRYAVVFEEGTEMLPAGLGLAASRTYQYLGVRSPAE